MKGKKPIKQAVDEYFAVFDLPSQMAHFVGKVLHIRPLEILENWGVPELAVAYGTYANEISTQNYETWKQMDAKERAKVERPKKYVVEFYGIDKLGAD